MHVSHWKFRHERPDIPSTGGEIDLLRQCHLRDDIYSALVRVRPLTVAIGPGRRVVRRGVCEIVLFRTVRAPSSTRLTGKVNVTCALTTEAAVKAAASKMESFIVAGEVTRGTKSRTTKLGGRATRGGLRDW